ncbi:hypothetical protein DM01DRAFT_1339315 [Hesseltinella vesiculosa]|uniref:RRM domain-containing protein n=1 Tax=Hesseltinella vesiculosa TaxID=101127 RepID=A0A1X2G7C9_9FUNG|nr:hypothetical protein DM01DRAFT_1339315 [Hesseltinella vesiculosa]
MSPERFETSDDESKVRAVPGSEVQEIKPSSGPTTEKGKAIVDYMQTVNKRSIYAKGFATTPEPDRKDVAKLFEPFGRVLKTKFRRDDEKNFKGSIFVEFENPEVAAAAVASNVTFKDEPLTLMIKDEYVTMKSIEKFNGEEFSQSNLDDDNTKRLYFVEYTGAEELDFSKLRELFTEYNKGKDKEYLGRFEKAREAGCGVVQLRDGTPDQFFATLEDNKLGPLTFRLASVDGIEQFRAQIRKRRSHSQNGRRFNKKPRGNRGGPKN